MLHSHLVSLTDMNHFMAALNGSCSMTISFQHLLYQLKLLQIFAVFSDIQEIHMHFEAIMLFKVFFFAKSK